MPLIELEACAVLLFVLKFLFGIDGRTEYKASLEAECKSRDENVVGKGLELCRNDNYFSSVNSFNHSVTIKCWVTSFDIQKYFVISRWLTQLSRRAHFLRRRGEFYVSYGSTDFEHIRSAAYLVRHEAKRRSGDFYIQVCLCT